MVCGAATEKQVYSRSGGSSQTVSGNADKPDLDPPTHVVLESVLTFSYTRQLLDFRFVSRNRGASAKVKSTTSSPVRVLMSWCMLTTLMPVTS